VRAGNGYVKAHSTSLHVNMLRIQICIFCFASGMINSHALIKCVLGTSETFGVSKFAFVFCFSLAL
jgi:hypothetical protein